MLALVQSRPWLAIVIAAGLAAASACGDDLYRERGALAPSDHLFVVAHPDDDLIFLQPELGDFVVRGDSITTLYLTAGQGKQGLSFAEARANGVLAAYGSLVGSPELARWRCGWVTLAAVPVWHCRHSEAPLSLAFLGITDGGKLGEQDGSLRQLWRGQVKTTQTVARQPSELSRAQLLDLLGAVLAATEAPDVHTLDFAGGHGRDHSDHLFAAAATATAVMQAGRPIRLRGHRGYNISEEPENRPSEAVRAGEQVLAFYDACVSSSCGGSCGQRPCKRINPMHQQWLSRRYVSSRRRLPARGRLSLGGSCLHLDRDGGVSLADCAVAADWRLLGDGTIRDPDGACLTARVTGELTMAACEGASGDASAFAGQRYLLDDDGNLFSSQLAPVVAPASDDEMPGRESILPCLSALDGRAVLARCSSARPGWNLQRTIVTTSLAELGVSARGRALQIARPSIEGTVAPPSLCALEDGNLLCAAGDGRGHFAPATPLRGVAAAPLRGDPQSLTWGDIDGDGAADACALAPGGLECVTAAGRYADARIWSASVAAGAEPALDPGSLRLLDIDGDGVADACHSAADGAVCARSTRELFRDLPEQRWRASAGGPADVSWFGDVDGDGRGEWCAARARGPECARNREASEREAPYPWGYALAGVVQGAPTSDGGALALDRVRLDDVNGDGAADLVFLRGAAVLVAPSTGTGFAPRGLLASLGGTSLVTGDLDGDGRADACTTGGDAADNGDGDGDGDGDLLRCVLSP